MISIFQHQSLGVRVRGLGLCFRVRVRLGFRVRANFRVRISFRLLLRVRFQGHEY